MIVSKPEWSCDLDFVWTAYFALVMKKYFVYGFFCELLIIMILVEVLVSQFLFFSSFTLCTLYLIFRFLFIPIFLFLFYRIFEVYRR